MYRFGISFTRRWTVHTRDTAMKAEKMARRRYAPHVMNMYTDRLAPELLSNVCSIMSNAVTTRLRISKLGK